MRFEFRLPDIGEGVVEGELVKLKVAVGDTVSEDMELFDVMTDKATVPIPSPKAGEVVAIHFKEGDIIPTGAVVIAIEVATNAPAPIAVPVATQPPLAATSPVPATVADAAPSGPVRASPATRKLASELGVDLRTVAGTGPHGRVTKDDLRAGTKPAPPPAAAALPPVSDAPLEERIPLRGLRRKIHDKMHVSKTTAAHFTYVEEVDFTEIVAMKERLAPDFAKRGVKLTFLPFVLKAVTASLKKPEFAYLNATLDDDRGEIVVKRSYHIGIAAATEPGLVVTVLRDADRLTLEELARGVQALAEGARAATLKPHDYGGSTFTITSLGALGGMFATPIINHPEVAILGLHKIEPRPVVLGGQIVIRDRMYMSCSFDHRLIDGHVGAAFVQSIRGYIERPETLFATLR